MEPIDRIELHRTVGTRGEFMAIGSTASWRPAGSAEDLVVLMTSDFQDAPSRQHERHEMCAA